METCNFCIKLCVNKKHMGVIKLNPNNILLFVIIIVGSVVFWWQRNSIEELQAVYERSRYELQSEMLQLQTKFDLLQAEKDNVSRERPEPTRRACKGKWENNNCIEPMITLLSPNGGETLCMGQKSMIRWEHTGSINVYISFGRPGGSYFYLPLLAADLNEQGKKGYGEYEWIIGKTSGGDLPESTTYEANIQGAASGDTYIEDKSDGIFSIIQCQG